MKFPQTKNIKKTSPKQVRKVIKKSKENKEVQMIREIAKIREQMLIPKEHIMADQTNYYRF